MKLKEEEIEKLIYDYPWILDERFVVPDIQGSHGEKGRQVNVGGGGLDRYIDLLFKDLRDDRPVIIEIKKIGLGKKDIAQILEYRALIVSFDEEDLEEWRIEFGNNCFTPKMILIGTEAPEEVKISANLAGVEIRLLRGIRKAEVDFSNFKQISNKLKEWDNFNKSGNRSLIERGEWVENIFEKIKSFIEEYNIDGLSTCKKLCYTTKKNSYYDEMVFPFINLPIYQNNNEVLGLYEYFDEDTTFSDKHIYCEICQLTDFIENKDENERTNAINRIKRYYQKKDYFGNKVFYFESEDESWTPYVLIDREILENEDKLNTLLEQLIKDSLKLAEMFNK